MVVFSVSNSLELFPARAPSFLEALSFVCRLQLLQAKLGLHARLHRSLVPSVVSTCCCCFCTCAPRIRLRKGERVRSRRSVLMEDMERSSLAPWLVQGRTQVAECSNLKLQQENREGGENSKAHAGVGSSPPIAMRGELQGGSRGSGARPLLMDYSEIPPSPPPQAPVHGSDRAAFGISKAAEVAVPAIDSVKSKQTKSLGDCVDDRNLLTRPKGKSSAEGRINDSHDPDGFSKNHDPIGPAPAPVGSHRSHEDEHGSQSHMPGTKDSSDCSAPESKTWMRLRCSRCKSANFAMYTDGKVESGVIRTHYQCNNCNNMLCRENVRSNKVEDRAEKGASQHTRRGNDVHGIIQAMSNLEPSTLATSNSNMKAMPPPSSRQKPNACRPDGQDTAFHSAKTTLPSRSSSCRDKLVADHPSRESNWLQLVVAPEPEERLPMKILEAKGPFLLSANLKEPPSNQSAEGNEKEPSFANAGFSVKGLRDSIRGHRSSPLQEKKDGSSGGTESDGGRPSNGLPCPSCKSTTTRFNLSAHYCDNCGKYWTVGHLQLHEAQLPSIQFAKGKGKEKETPCVDADQFSGKGLGYSSRGPRSLPVHGSEDGDGGSNEGPLNALRCSHCKSTFTRLCTYGVFCDACGKHSLYVGTRDREVPANPPVAKVHEVFDADGRSGGYQLQSLPPPRRPMVDASTQTDPVAMVPVDSRFGKHIVHGLLHTHTHQVDERKRRRGN